MIEKVRTMDLVCEGWHQDLSSLWCDEVLTDDCSDKEPPGYPLDPDWLDHYIFLSHSFPSRYGGKPVSVGNVNCLSEVYHEHRPG